MVLSELKSREFYRQTIHLLVPVMLQQLITTGINFLDNIMVGSFGETQIAAAALANQFYAIFQFVCMGLGSGAVVIDAEHRVALGRLQLLEHCGGHDRVLRAGKHAHAFLHGDRSGVRRDDARRLRRRRRTSFRR